MVTYANITPAPLIDGMPYCQGRAMPSLESDLFNLTSPPFFTPVPVIYGQAVQAIVQLTIVGSDLNNTTYIVMQTDLGDGVWIDVAWILWTGISGSAIFVMSGGVAGANAFEQTRQIGSAPGSNGSNQMALGGRVRFMGKSTITGTGSSSAAPGQPAIVYATVNYKLLALR